jgi:hypothetical protein
MTRIHPFIAITNESSVINDADMPLVLGALRHQVIYDFAPAWGVSATLEAGEKSATLSPTKWGIVIADDSDQAGALGYHETTSAGMPQGFVFARTDKEDGLSWTVTLSHELLEMLGDPYANLTAQLNNSELVAYETADAVEADDDGYDIGGIQLSNFVLPRWFEPGVDGPYDYRHLLDAPLTLRPGGYIAVAKATSRGLEWSQVTHGVPRHDHSHRFARRVAQSRALAGRIRLA